MEAINTAYKDGKKNWCGIVEGSAFSDKN